MATERDYGAIVLAGGRASRLSGVDKPALLLAGETLLDRVLAAVPDADPLVVVGPDRTLTAPGGQPIHQVREQPPGGGPVAAAVAGLAALTTAGTSPTMVALLAGDLAGLRPDTVSRLRGELTAAEAGAVLVDLRGRRQWLIGVWWLAALRAAIPADPVNKALRTVLGGLSVREVPAREGETDDVDTEADLRRLGIER
ncbi:molybdopterin-guanine dinucleotide biosynthesis protein A [Tamaricihabitans halophyticus]|uniref:Molybdopterin-guanine dinucleotide biosynthesis protein A n=1 Tax=Tamaricihabitans halophyticus TaxID=1262583 RepID=A0A4R2QQA3_9PSEU|nr:NTP transferase domain-containing protein [Tamaricihabitans halophyticus]TCP50848.1 molybdopterin-guanine dinucleotide biosynthesis protein A [Tamaricihabitans halophyticus]